MNKSLYELLNMKAKNSIYKSVFITDRETFENYPIITVEPYDDTFLNATRFDSGYEKTLRKIMKKVYAYMKTDTWLIIYTDHGRQEFLLSEYYMKEVYELI